jgi:hypothetical protein
MQCFIVQLITEPKVKNSCVLTELEDEIVSENLLAPTADTQTMPHSAVLEVSEDEAVENTTLPGNLTPINVAANQGVRLMSSFSVAVLG